ncbi:MAG: hypothetical protein WBQ50_09145, partial [Nocardioides sp.]
SGAEVDLLPDGSRDVTALVAVDSVADKVGGAITTQREALRRLGVSGARPNLRQATDDPAGYARALSTATEAAELCAAGGLGDLWWIVVAIGDIPTNPLAPA